MTDIEKCPACEENVTEEDLEEGHCAHCNFVFENDDEDLLEELGKDESDKLHDAYNEEDGE